MNWFSRTIAEKELLRKENHFWDEKCVVVKCERVYPKNTPKWVEMGNNQSK